MSHCSLVSASSALLVYSGNTGLGNGQLEQAERIVHQVYEAANNPEYWAAVCDDLSELVGGGAVHVLLASTDTGDEYVNLFTKGDPEFASEYLRDYASVDFRVPRVMARKLGIFGDEREYVSTRDVRSSPIHQELLPRYGVHKIGGANMSLDGCIGWFGISTRSSNAEFDGTQMSMLGHVSKHLLNALKIAKSQQDFRISRNSAFAGLDLANAAILLFDRNTLEYANVAAHRLFEGDFFLLHHNKLVCRRPVENKRLAQFLELAADGRSVGSVLIRDPEDAASYIVRSHDLFPRYVGAGIQKSRYRGISILELNLPANCGLDEVMEFCIGYGVSPSEAKAVHGVLTSTSLAESAENRGISLNTIQQQLKSAMTKMEMNSQKKIFQAFERYRSYGDS